MNQNLIYICEICGTVLNEHHCKAQCPNCGRMFDCSDLPIFQANATINSEAGEIVMRPGSNPLELAPHADCDAEHPADPQSPPPQAAPAKPASKLGPGSPVADLP